MSKVVIPQIRNMEVVVGGKRSDQDRRTLLIGVIRISDVSRETLVARKGDGTAFVCNFRLAFSARVRLHVLPNLDISSSPFPLQPNNYAKLLPQIESLNPLTDLPIICGGTHYYTQHFLFPPARLNLDRSSVEGSKSNNTKWRPPCTLAEVLDTLDRTDPEVSERIRTEPGVREFLETFWTASPIVPDSWRAGPDGELLALHRLLAVVDVREAGRWHWRDGRKVRRGLERWWEGMEGVTRGKGDVQPENSRWVTWECAH